jgi:hypothetical protein
MLERCLRNACNVIKRVQFRVMVCLKSAIGFVVVFCNFSVLPLLDGSALISYVRHLAALVTSTISVIAFRALLLTALIYFKSLTYVLKKTFVKAVTFLLR